MFRTSSEEPTPVDKTIRAKKSWLTRPLFTHSQRVPRALRVGAVLFLVLGIMSPALVTLAWHLRYGNTIESRGKKVFVPLTWIADIGDSNDAELNKLPLILPLLAREQPFEGMIWFGQSLPAQTKDVEQLYKSSESIFWNLHSDFGETISGPFRRGSGAQEAFCMEATETKVDWSSVSCLVLRGKWQADFMGRKKNMEDFFTIIQKLN